MLKKLCIAAIVTVVCLAAGVTAFASPVETTILRFEMDSTTFTRNGVPHQTDVAPFVDAAYDRAMLPLRVIAEELGIAVNWMDGNRMVILERGGISISLQIDSPLPDGMGMPQIVNDRAMVPVRYIAETLGVPVSWDGNARTIIITESPPQDPITPTPQVQLFTPTPMPPLQTITPTPRAETITPTPTPQTRVVTPPPTRWSRRTASTPWEWTVTPTPIPWITPTPTPWAWTPPAPPLVPDEQPEQEEPELEEPEQQEPEEEETEQEEPEEEETEQEEPEEEETEQEEPEEEEPEEEEPEETPIRVSDRRLTDTERAAWINAYRAAGGPSSFELRVAELVSEIRVQYSLSSVSADETLMMAGRFYAQTMYELNTIGHNVGPYQIVGATHGASQAVVRAFGGSLRWNGGNAASGHLTPESVVDGWMNSPGHRNYILSPEHVSIGVGRSGSFTYLFLSDN